MVYELSDLRGLLNTTPNNEDEEAWELDDVVDFLCNLPDLSPWDLRGHDEFYDSQSMAEVTGYELRKITMKHALRFLLGDTNTYFDALISYQKVCQRNAKEDG